jgi:isoaspartyl peptidase/L-asparaginase-like protein (Ntn-hydrolase superfamily)
MPLPMLISTWSFGQRANRAGWDQLTAGRALDAAERACLDAEEDLENHTVGVGGYPDHTGRVSLDASVMLSPARSGAVCGIRRHAQAISIARAVMEKTPHRMLCGSDADDFAATLGFKTRKLLTGDARLAWEKWIAAGRPHFPLANLEDQIRQRAAEARPIDESHHDTIGVLAIDANGTLAGGCTTSGLAFKLAGRVGDSPIIGHGIYVDPSVGACVCTGRGELITGLCASYLAVESLRRGATLRDAIQTVLDRAASVYDLGADDQAGIIMIDRDGNHCCGALLDGFRYAIRTADRDEVLEPEIVLKRGRTA